MKANIKMPQKGLSNVALAALTRTVITKMTDNANFPTPAVVLKTLTTQVTAFEKATENAVNGSKISKLERDELGLIVLASLREQADYVKFTCKGDKAMLVSSGFELYKTPEKHGIPNAPIIKSAHMTGIKGQISLKWDKQVGTTVYQIWMTDSDPASENPNWTPVAATGKLSTTVDNLISYKAYWFSVSAIGSAGEGAKSDPAIVNAA